MNKQIILNHFLSAIIMGQEIFSIYKDKAKDEKLKNIIEDFINSLINQKKEMEKYMPKSYIPDLIKIESLKEYMLIGCILLGLKEM